MNDLTPPTSLEIALARLTVAVADLAQTMSGGYASVAVRLDALEARLSALEPRVTEWTATLAGPGAPTTETVQRSTPPAPPKPKRRPASQPRPDGIAWPPTDATLDALLTAYIDGPDSLVKLLDDCNLPRSGAEWVRQYANRTGRAEQYQAAVARSRELGKVNAANGVRAYYAQRRVAS